MELNTLYQEYQEWNKQAWAELCQAQAKVSFPAEAELYLTVEFQIWALQDKTYTYI